MDEWERLRIEEYIREQEGKINMANRSYVQPGAGPGPVYNQAQTQPSYSLAEVQTKGGGVVAMTITASPSIGKHLTDTMKSSGFLYLYNEKETLLIRAEDVVAVRLTKLSTE
jgi:hypothetical protein